MHNINVRHVEWMFDGYNNYKTYGEVYRPHLREVISCWLNIYINIERDDEGL